VIACPPAAPHVPAPAAASSTLLVPHDPTAAQLCRYGRLPSRRLLASRRVTDEAAPLASRLDGLPRMPRKIFCPMDDGAEIVLTFTYAREANARAVVELTGCRTATGAHLPVRRATQTLVSRLLALLR
jgi:hypothetical protein